MPAMNLVELDQLFGEALNSGNIEAYWLFMSRRLVSILSQERKSTAKRLFVRLWKGSWP